MSSKCMMILRLGVVIVSGMIGQIGYSQENNIKLTVEPDDIKTNMFYNGTVLNINAQFPRCEGVAVKFEGASGTIELNRKGKVGPLWMNVARITVSDAPHTYIYAASDKLEELCSDDELEKIGLGYESLRKRVSFTTKSSYDSEFGNFIMLQEDEGLYGAFIGDRLKPESALNGKLSMAISIPSVIPSGDYKLYLYCFKDGNVIAQLEKEVTIEKAGLPRFMSLLAFEHAALYGIIAIVVAMGTGALMGVVFSFLGRGGR